MTTLGGLGHTLPYLIPDFWTATASPSRSSSSSSRSISWIRHRYMDTPFLQAAFQVVVGGVLVFLAGILIGRLRDAPHFVLAHLSDPHLGAAAAPRLRELAGQARARLSQLAAQAAQPSTAPTCWKRIVADLKAQEPDHIAVDRRPRQLALPDEFAPARAGSSARPAA